MPRLNSRTFSTALAAELARPRHQGLTLYWLGQAGFVFDTPQLRIIIDPYLSDSLEAKYRGTPSPHDRMVPAPVTPQELGKVDLVLCTHQHTDHLDGETLRPLALRLPKLRFVVPAAAFNLARERIGVDRDRLIAVNAGQTLEPLAGLGVTVLRAAHEALEIDADGHHKCLGYGITLGRHRVFHSGDTIPFAGQDAEVRNFAAHIALLPVNGRSSLLKDAGFAGNLTLAEASGLTARCGIPSMIAHHHGMFAFNTADPRAIDAAASSTSFQMLRAQFQTAYESVLQVVR